MTKWRLVWMKSIAASPNEAMYIFGPVTLAKVLLLLSSESRLRFYAGSERLDRKPNEFGLYSVLPEQLVSYQASLGHLPYSLKSGGW